MLPACLPQLACAYVYTAIGPLLASVCCSKHGVPLCLDFCRRSHVDGEYKSAFADASCVFWFKTKMVLRVSFRMFLFRLCGNEAAPFLQAQHLFTAPNVQPAAEVQLNFEQPREQELIWFLTMERHFSKVAVLEGVEVLKVRIPGWGGPPLAQGTVWCRPL